MNATTTTPSPATQLSADAARALWAAGWMVDTAVIGQETWKWNVMHETGMLRIELPSDHDAQLKEMVAELVRDELRRADFIATSTQTEVLVGIAPSQRR